MAQVQTLARPASSRGSTKGTKKDARARKAPAAKASVINLRCDADTHSLIERACAATGQNRTEFMLASARASAQQALLDRTFFSLSDADWKAFNAQLDAPAEPTEALRKLMARTPPWDE